MSLNLFSYNRQPICKPFCPSRQLGCCNFDNSRPEPAGPALLTGEWDIGGRKCAGGLKKCSDPSGTFFYCSIDGTCPKFGKGGKGGRMRSKLTNFSTFAACPFTGMVNLTNAVNHKIRMAPRMSSGKRTSVEKYEVSKCPMLIGIA